MMSPSGEINPKPLLDGNYAENKTCRKRLLTLGGFYLQKSASTGQTELSVERGNAPVKRFSPPRVGSAASTAPEYRWYPPTFPAEVLVRAENIKTIY